MYCLEGISLFPMVIATIHAQTSAAVQLKDPPLVYVYYEPPFVHIENRRCGRLFYVESDFVLAFHRASGESWTRSW
jgi:hypothetical protein